MPTAIWNLDSAKLISMSNNNKKIVSCVLTTGFFLLSVSWILALEPPKLKYEFPCQNLPGSQCPSSEDTASDPAAYIARLYQFALVAAVMLSLGMIIFGGLQYILSRGKPAAQSDANDRIIQALWGLVLLLGAFLILNTIDPELTNLKLPLTRIEAPIIESEQRVNLGGEGSFCSGPENCLQGYECVEGKCVLPETPFIPIGESSSEPYPESISDLSIPFVWIQNDPLLTARYCQSVVLNSFCPGQPPPLNNVCCQAR